ncbi:MAG: hypothetical protein J1G06_06660 [Oscillospiraceae bacterium]|nr:hypothetical protein [Oscillospiraceae bacterium]
MSIRIGNSDAYISNEDLTDGLMILVGVVIGLAIICGIIHAIIRNSDNGKPLNSCNVKILEKISSQGKIAWYVVEKENGVRLRLRTFHANTLFISEGDAGTITYRGKTITSFARERR